MVTLFHGKNTFLSKKLVDAALEGLKKKAEKKEIPYEVLTYDASSTPADEIIAEIETPSMFNNRKIILVKRTMDSDDKDKLQECLINNLENNDYCDIIIWEDQKLRSNLRFIRPFKDAGTIEEAPDLNKRTFKTWAKEQAEAQDLSISGNAMYLLSERVNYDPERLTRELSKIKLLGKSVIEEEDIERLCPDTLEHSIWDLMDAINKGDLSTAERKLNLVIRQGNDPLFVLLMIARNLRITLLTKLLMQKGASTSEIARKIKVPPFTVSAIKRNAENTSFDRIISLYDKISNIDYSGKTGQLDVELALNILLSVI